VSDLVELTVFGSPCNAKDCGSAMSRTFPQCTTVQVPDSNPISYTNQAGDLLNDCERILLTQVQDNPTVADTWMPTSLALASGLALSSARTSLALDPFNDGMSNYEKVKHNIPTTMPMSTIVGLVPLHYALEPVSKNLVQSCYHLEATNIVAGGAGDSILVYLLEAPRGKNNHLLRTAKKSLDANGRVTFSDDDLR
jgi:hypothetical protein